MKDTILQAIELVRPLLDELGVSYSEEKFYLEEDPNFHVVCFRHNKSPHAALVDIPRIWENDVEHMAETIRTMLPPLIQVGSQQ